MSEINTVLGPISPDALGVTLPHEHVVAGYAGFDYDPYSRPYNLDKMVQICQRALEPAKGYGLNSLVDATPMDLNRDVDLLKAVSEKMQINIVCATGRYTEDMGKWTYLKQRARSKIGDMQTELYESFMYDITQGIGKTGVKAGVIKVATGFDCISACEGAMLRAAARASKETGLPIITHTENGTMGPEQVELLVAEGVNPKSIMIGHMCGNPSMQYQLAVLNKGVNISFDRFGIEVFQPDKVRLANLIGLLGIGYTDKIMISQDFIACGFGRGGVLPEEERQKVANWSFINIFRNILPALKQAGVTDEQIKTIMVDNPRRLLSGV
ncbi:MAG: phosphotriesterase-related protein [Dehalococcoidia bacterium]|nr:phosphotriesterase-related protein [Dehalococcoidia bacterium]MDD5494085.1 phosphotriesterase-related protein [Dehalococcoidia bacterium]